MKNGIKIIGFILSAAIVAFAINSLAQYDPPAVPETNVKSAEKGRSLTDCLTFAANFDFKNQEADQKTFKKQFGDPVSSFGAVREYNYDKHTKIFLNCTAEPCKASCKQ